jgi:hypothetical protein
MPAAFDSPASDWRFAPMCRAGLTGVPARRSNGNAAGKKELSVPCVRIPGQGEQRSGLKPNRIPGSAEKCSASARNSRSASARNGVRNQPGILFGFSQERCSPCPGIRIHGNYLSQRDIEICLGLDLGTFADLPGYENVRELHDALVETYSGGGGNASDSTP